MAIAKNLSAVLIALSAWNVWADHDADALAKATANPVANLISVPLQSNWDKGYGPDNETQYTMNIQPVIPFDLSEDWLVITRTIVPVIHQPGMTADQDDAWGVGDVLASQFFSPRSNGAVIWGVGPAWLLPSASRNRLGTEQWAAGPTGVVLVQQGPWTYGVLANYLHSYAGSDDRADVDAYFANPFFTYGFGGGWSATLQAEYTYNRDAKTDERELANAQVVVSRVIKLGNQPMSVGVGYKSFTESPRGQPDEGVRFVVNLLFPK